MDATTTKTDPELQQQVLQELKWDPRVDETEVGVQVEKGIVTLTGAISSYAKRIAAVQAAHRVHGVLDVADDLEVEIPSRDRPSDPDIAQAVRDALHWHSFVDERNIRSTVSGGWVTLEGEVARLYQRDDASRAIQRLKGVRGVTNKLTVRTPDVDETQLRSTIEGVLSRQAEREAKHIGIQVREGVITLYGTVRSYAERKAVKRAVEFAPGVKHVQDNLTVNSYV